MQNKLFFRQNPSVQRVSQVFKIYIEKPTNGTALPYHMCNPLAITVISSFFNATLTSILSQYFFLSGLVSLRDLTSLAPPKAELFSRKDTKPLLAQIIFRKI